MHGSNLLVFLCATAQQSYCHHGHGVGVHPPFPSVRRPVCKVIFLSNCFGGQLVGNCRSTISPVFFSEFHIFIFFYETFFLCETFNVDCRLYFRPLYHSKKLQCPEGDMVKKKENFSRVACKNFTCHISFICKKFMCARNTFHMRT